MSGEVLDVVQRLVLSAPGEVVVLVLAVAVALPAPDVDLWAIRLLHHRSILTHSVLLPLLVSWFLPELGPAAVAGVSLGVAVHLAADLLSPSHGFGRVYWPEPFQVSLGRWSALWLMLNALGASWLAVAVLPAGEAWRYLAAGVGAVAAVGYGLRKERSVLSALVALGVVAAGHAPRWWLG
ncbi:hypothetical protein Rumeso_00382 [Rubellimicrobium mesophilum DSM 19309]|uniref:Uncharacterized protein n=1 Tax=Rubellimicrobium mesophilum DSM 19309 TaxID=442562 RepID=A0A017HUS6_9RHOB|nr:hypothetical protein [Rubellimicrobium mesophilum]EYD78045.1 hypothetical protein Rumeso_00382 [Rubellimicrobium mesophilum DSM 19309]